MLRLAAHSPALHSLLLNDLLSSRQDGQPGGDLLRRCLLTGLASWECSSKLAFVAELLGALRQTGNSVAVYDLLTSVLDWLLDQSYDATDGEFAKLLDIVVCSLLFTLSRFVLFTYAQ